ncbi:MAG: hypothetical protein N2561_06250 [Bacteroidetes bacterium]|nr:hypothetical protein [Rhodothermia bacterium]MCX7907121.1 hypothetical protein [Bacteroidota bacterium]MDW8285531.1 hypothetical protein [Bacteroidota bacterium]
MLFVLFWPFSPAFGQGAWAVHGQIGPTVFRGDYDPGPWRLGLSIGGARELWPDAWLGAEWGWLPFQARVRPLWLSQHPQLPSSIQADPMYLSLLLRWTPRLGAESWYPVLEAGAGLMWLEPQNASGARLRSLPETRAPGESYSGLGSAFPLRIGLAREIHPRWAVRVLVEAWLPLQDYWDNTSHLANPRTKDALWGLRVGLLYLHDRPLSGSPLPAENRSEDPLVWTVRIVTLASADQAVQVRAFLSANRWEVEMLEKPDPIHGRLWVLFFGRYSNRQAGESDRARIEALLRESPYFRLDPNPPEVVLLRTLRLIRNQE